MKEVEKSYNDVRSNFDKLNKEIASKVEELESKGSELKDVESRLQLSLRFDSTFLNLVFVNFSFLLAVDSVLVQQ